MKHIVLSILAHVDAGKTTLIESLLYTAGTIRQPGRVDKQTTVLDDDIQERERGITIYAKEAGFAWRDTGVQVIDTPGHADFSSEMERGLSAADLAVVIVSGLDGVQSHTKTIWRLLEAAGRRRGFLISGGEVDTERMAKILLDEFRSGKLGRFTLEAPQ